MIINRSATSTLLLIETQTVLTVPDKSSTVNAQRSKFLLSMLKAQRLKFIEIRDSAHCNRRVTIVSATPGPRLLHGRVFN